VASRAGAGSSAKRNTLLPTESLTQNTLCAALAGAAAASKATPQGAARVAPPGENEVTAVPLVKATRSAGAPVSATMYARGARALASSPGSGGRIATPTPCGALSAHGSGSVPTVPFASHSRRTRPLPVSANSSAAPAPSTLPGENASPPVEFTEAAVSAAPSAPPGTPLPASGASAQRVGAGLVEGEGTGEAEKEAPPERVGVPVGVPVALAVGVALGVAEGEAPAERVPLGVPVAVTLGVGVPLREGGVGERVGDDEGVAPGDSVPDSLGVAEPVGEPVPVLVAESLPELLGVPVANSPVPVGVSEGVGVGESER
jgi:hypothetical protein